MKPAPSIGRVTLLVVSFLVAPSLVSAGTVRTLAGSGAPGIVDGPGATARFLMPTAVAYAPDGTLIVADSAAQRIRAVSPAGVVSTIAGSGNPDSTGLVVAPGFRDGDVRSARFNWPRGVAVAKDGTIYVADTGNHCVRAIKEGLVRTVFGSPARPGGPLSRPIGIAVNASGDVYVADPDVGMLKLDRSGAMTAIPGFHGPYGVALMENGAGEWIFGADADGLYERLPYEPTDYRYFSVNRTATSPATSDPKRTLIERTIPFDYPVGFTGGIAVYGYDMFTSDVRTDSIRYMWSGWAPMMRVLAGSPHEDASGATAGFADGSGATARFNAPMGLAVRDRTTLVVADSGNRRIRMLQYDIESEVEATRGQQLDIETGVQHGEEDYAIAMIGNSFVSYDAVWADSIPGLVQRRLRSDGVAIGDHLRPALRMGGGVNGLETLDSLVKTIAGTASYRAVVLNLNYVNFGGPEALVKYQTSVSTAIAHLTYARKVLADAGIPIIAAIHPIGDEMSPSDAFATRMHVGAMVPELRVHKLMLDALAGAGIEVIDAYPSFAAQDVTPTDPLFGTANTHFARHGRLVMAAAVADGLERLKPWNRVAK